MKKKIKTLALITATIGVAAVIKRANGLQTQINEIKTTQKGLQVDLSNYATQDYVENRITTI